MRISKTSSAIQLHAQLEMPPSSIFAATLISQTWAIKATTRRSRRRTRGLPECISDLTKSKMILNWSWTRAMHNLKTPIWWLAWRRMESSSRRCNIQSAQLKRKHACSSSRRQLFRQFCLQRQAIANEARFQFRTQCAGMALRCLVLACTNFLYSKSRVSVSLQLAKTQHMSMQPVTLWDTTPRWKTRRRAFSTTGMITARVRSPSSANSTTRPSRRY